MLVLMKNELIDVMNWEFFKFEKLFMSVQFDEVFIKDVDDVFVKDIVVYCVYWVDFFFGWYEDG